MFDSKGMFGLVVSRGVEGNKIRWNGMEWSDIITPFYCLDILIMEWSNISFHCLDTSME